MEKNISTENNTNSEKREKDQLVALSKQEYLANSLKTQLACGPIKAADILQVYRSIGISEKTLQITKKIMGIKSFRMNGAWYWSFPGAESESIKKIAEEGID